MRKFLKIILSLLALVVWSAFCVAFGWVGREETSKKTQGDWKPNHCIEMYNRHYGKVASMIGAERHRQSDTVETISISYKKDNLIRKMVCTYNDETGIWGVQEEK